MKKRNSERGSITLFVLIACMFFIIILLIINIGVINKNTKQERELEEISKAYEVNENDIDDTYKKVVDESQYTTIEDVQDLIDENKPKIEDISIIPYEGVSIYKNNCKKIGRLVIINMKIQIDTSKINISSSNDIPTPIMKIESAKLKENYILDAYYAVEEAKSSHETQGAFAILQKGELKISYGKENPYTSGWMINISGIYIADE